LYCFKPDTLLLEAHFLDRGMDFGELFEENIEERGQSLRADNLRPDRDFERSVDLRGKVGRWRRVETQLAGGENVGFGAQEANLDRVVHHR
jgi:hypothetical protein